MVQNLQQMLKVFRYVGQRSRSRSQGQRFWYQQKGFITGNVHVKYKSPASNGSKIMAHVKFSDMQVKGHGQGRKVKTFSMNGKASSQGMYM